MKQEQPEGNPGHERRRAKRDLLGGGDHPTMFPARDCRRQQETAGALVAELGMAKVYARDL